MLTHLDLHRVKKLTFGPPQKIERPEPQGGSFWIRDLTVDQGDGYNFSVQLFAEKMDSLMVPGDTFAGILSAEHARRNQHQANERSQPNVIPTPEQMPQGDVT